MSKTIKMTILSIIIIIIINILIVQVQAIQINEMNDITRENFGFYTIQYWNEQQQQWLYIKYARLYYTDHNGEKRIVYSTNKNIDDKKVNTILIQSQSSNSKIERVLLNGYPNKTPDEIGVETEDDAYLATEQAICFIMKDITKNDIYKYIRAYKAPINNQNQDITYERGNKVINAIYKLLDLSENANDESSDGDLENINNYIDDNCYIKSYQLTGTDEKIKIDGITSDSIDSQSININSREDGQAFNIKIPETLIKNDFNLNLKYELEYKRYLLYNAIDSTNNKYIIAKDENANKECNLPIKIDAHKGSLIIKDTDDDTKEPIEETAFDIRDSNGNDEGIYLTDKNGEIILNNLVQGYITLKEININSNYKINPYENKIEIRYNQQSQISVQNRYKKGNLQIRVVNSEDNNEAVQNAQFDLINSYGNVVKHLITDINGNCELNDINIGDYDLREIQAPDNYNITEDKHITIQDMNTLQVQLENNKKGAKLNITVEDQDNNKIKIPNVEINVCDINDNIIDRVITDKEGMATTKMLPCGKYKIKETSINENYVLDNIEKEIQIESNQDTTLSLKNEKLKGYIKVISTSGDYNDIIKKPIGEAIENVKFRIYDSRKNIVQEIITDKNGIAKTNKLLKGEYTIKEIQSGSYYLLNKTTYNVLIKDNNQIIQIPIIEKSERPSVDIEVNNLKNITTNGEAKYVFGIENTGNVALSKFVLYDFLPYEYSKITKISTGTYDQDVNYNIYYRTNKKNNYQLLKANINSKTNNYIDLSNIQLEVGEVITELKIDFGNVDVGFRSNENLCIMSQIVNNQDNNKILTNGILLEGYDKEYKASNIKILSTILKNDIKHQNNLPRTGF